MITGLNKDAKVEYICEKDKGKENPTKFSVGVLTYLDRMKIVEVYSTQTDNISSLAKINQEIINKYITTDNLLVDGKPMKVTENLADYLEIPIITELMKAISVINRLRPGEEKN